MKIQSLCGFALAIASNAIFAQQTYNVEVNVEHYKHVERRLLSDGFGDNSLQYTGMGATYYFTPVRLDPAQPFDELAFMQKANRASASYQFAKYGDAFYTYPTDAGGDYWTRVDGRIKNSTVSGRWYVDWLVAELELNQLYTRAEDRANRASNWLETSSKPTIFGLGVRPFSNSEIMFYQERYNISYKVPPATANKADAKKNSRWVNSHTVFDFSGGQFLVTDLTYTQMESKKGPDEAVLKNHEASGSLKFYPQSNWYVQFESAKNSGEAKEIAGRTKTFGMGYSFDSNWSAHGSASQVLINEPGATRNFKSAKLDVHYRF